MREQVPWDVPIDLAPIADHGIPALVMCGDWDPGFTAVSRHLANRLAGRLVELPGANHFFMEQGPAIATEVRAHWQH